VEALSRTVYIVTASVEPEWEADFNRWYDEEHVPALLAVPGYRSGTRYVAVEGEPKYMAFWEIDSMDAYTSEAHDTAVNTPWTARGAPHRDIQMAFYEQIFPDQRLLKGASWGQSVGGLLINRIDVAPEGEQDFNVWYNEEHQPALCAVPGAIAARRFRAIQGEPRYMAMVYLTDPAIQASEAWHRAADTPWTARSRAAYRNRWRVVYQPYH
jgi:antibiotic biosynthesis monooxygenase (ABM) superfamily enzyme